VQVRSLPRRRNPDNARSAALAVLEGVEFGGGSSNALLADIDVRGERDRHLATTLVYGVLRQRRVLDRLIERTSRRPLSEIDPPTLVALRLALFQILFLTRVPRSAAVDETVSLVRARRGRGAAAFANGVLRAAGRLLDGGFDPMAPLPAQVPDPALFLAEAYSFPPVLVSRYLKVFGREECEALLDTFNRPAAVVLRAVRGCDSPDDLVRRLRDEGVEAVPSPVLTGALRVVRGAPQRTRAFRDGLIYIQDEAAQIVALMLRPIDAACRMLDLCAAPGGKLLAVAETAPLDGVMVAADGSRARLRVLEENSRRLRVGGILRLVTDAALPGLRGRFDRVLLDAPCSGTGVIRRHPEIRWRRDAADISAAAAFQARALRAAAELVSPSGRLVYSVCSLEPEEGRERIVELLRERRDFEIADARTILPSALHRFVDGAGFLATLPQRDDVDGFFAAALRRT